MSTQEHFNEAAEALRRAVDARGGDSNDEEIEALWEAVEALADIAAVPMPLPHVSRKITVTVNGRLSDHDLGLVGRTISEAIHSSRLTANPVVEDYTVDWNQ